MKRFFSLIFVFVLMLSVASCGDSKKENPVYEEQVSKEIKAEEGGKVESSDGNTSIEIPADALDSDTKITMTIYDVSGYAAIPDKIGGMKVVSKVVEFEPSGTVFKKPVIISMTATEAFENKIVSAAVFYEKEGRLSYSEHGAYGVMGRDAAGDPIMTTAAGDPIMLSDGNLTTGAGDPIMNSAAGDPIMMASAGDPIMNSAAGDPIMNAAAGDPIMMATGHFTAYTFITIDPKEPEKEPEEPEEPEKDEEPVVEDDDDEPVVEDDDDPVVEDDDDPVVEDDDEPVVDEDEIVDEDETPDVDEDIVVPEPPVPVLSKVLCTGLTKCSDGEMTIDCPAEGEDFYGQDAQFVATKSCVPHKYSIQTEPVAVGEDPEEGEGTGLRNILRGNSNNANIRNGVLRDGETGETYEFVLDENTHLKWIVFSNSASHENAKTTCEGLTYGGHTWRLPKVKELLSISDHDRFASATDESYFRDWGYNYGFWADDVNLSSGNENNFWVYNADDASLMYSTSTPTGGSLWAFACVSGEEYGKPGEYEVRNIGGKEVVFDPSTNLLWQKGSVPVNNWKSALAYCQNLDYAGYSDWRLPNKNELVTLVDYSRADPASSFPGMTSEKLISSTFTVSYGGAGDAIAVNMANGLVGEGSSAISVLCVRSSSQPLPEGRTIPYCDESRIAPCEDAVTNYVWSSAQSVDSNYSASASWMSKAIQCRESSEGGISKWRIPTIDEVRTLLSSSENLKTGGECHVTNECFDYASEACFEEAACAPEYETDGEMIRSSLFDYSGYLTGTPTSLQDDGYTWFVNLRSGVLERIEENAYIEHESRCIMDPSLPDPVATPYTDSAHSIVWTSRSKKYIQYWYDAARYCTELVEGGSNNWRVPSMEELRTLVQNCPEGDCDMDLTGNYSFFGDISNLWSSDVTGNNTGYTLDFLTASEKGDGISYYREAKVRCVRSLSDSVTVQELDDSDFPYTLPDLIWSKVSDDAYYYSDEAQEYCDELNEDEYGGYTEWTLPTSSELASIIRKAVCSNKTDFLTGGTGRCSQYTFEGYSFFGDMFALKAKDNYTFDFAEGTMDSYGYGRVRCVIVAPDDSN
ncbi:DUF1566 domain-containing protein [bacterium]|nr:DUF1566 domain-containing protein [bacterium]